MRFDVENQLCAAQAFTGAATVSASSYQIANYSAVGNKPDISIGRRMSLLVMVTTAAGAGSTHTMEAISADNAALTSNVTSLASISVLAATLSLGYAFELPIPQGSINQLFLGFRNTSTGGTTTVSLDVYLVPADEIPKFKSFPKVVDAAV
jgi:hypothetical protein